MQLNGVYVGIGKLPGQPGDTSPEVRKLKDFILRKWDRFDHRVSPGNEFDSEMESIIMELQRIYAALGQIGGHIPGVVNLETKYALGYMKRPPKALPVIFTVEGHLSNMWSGPCATIASMLEQQGVCLWRPVGYDCGRMPFNNADGVEQVRKRVAATVYDDGKLFPVDDNWGVIGFSQGAMIVSEFMQKHVLPENGSLHWRLPTFRRGLGLGNPRREFGVVAPWADDPPPTNTGGIMDKLFVTRGTVIEDRWRENANIGDMFAQNKRDEAGEYKTAVAKMITEGSVFGSAGIFTKAFGLIASLPTELIPAAKAAVSAIMFLATNPNPHYTTYAEIGDIAWMRGVAA